MDDGTFGERLREARTRANLTQEELAERAGITPNAVGALERNEHRHPYPATVRALAAALNLSQPESAALAASVPARRRSARVPHNGNQRGGLPAELTPLIGRDLEIAHLSAVLRREDTRLVTLTGPGGVGKSQLAFSVARLASAAFTETVVLELASVGDSRLVASSIAQAFGIPEHSGIGLARRLIEVLRQRRVLLLLDNFEHLLPATPVITELLAACAGLTILTTSRVALRITGEQEVPVHPLAIPPDTPSPNVEELGSVDSVRLFVARAAGFDPAFALTAEQAPSIAAICRQLDGLPLALELAAARTPHLTPAAIHERLARRLPFLTAGRRDAPARHRTLRDAIAWSYQLLDPSDQRHFRQLSVFAGGCTLDGVEAVLEADSSGSLEALSVLIDQNLLRKVTGTGPQSRYRMLETVREYAAEQLTELGETDLVHARHAAWCVDLVEAHWPDLYSIGWPSAVARLIAEQDNLRAAMNWLHSHQDADGFVRLTGALGRYWHITGAHREGRAWLERALAPTAAIRSVGRARSLASAGYLAHCLGDDDTAVIQLELAAQLSRELDDPWMEAGAMLDLGIVEEDRGNFDTAEAHFTAALDRFERNHHRQGPLLARHHLGIIAYARRDWARAEALWEDGIAEARRVGDPLTLAWNLEFLALMLAERGDSVRAAEALRALRSLNESGAIAHLGRVLATIAVLGSTLENPVAERAAVSLQAAASIADEIDGERPALPERDAFERAEKRLRGRLGDEVYRTVWDASRSINPEKADQAIAEILDAAIRDTTPTDVIAPGSAGDGA